MDTVTQTNMDDMFEVLARGRERFGEYEFEELAEPEEKKCFQGITDLFVSTINRGLDSLDKGETNSKAILAMVLPSLSDARLSEPNSRSPINPENSPLSCCENST